MNQKERKELRRHISPDRCGISRIYGCFVNGNREILSQMDESLGLMTEFESESFLGLLKKTLSGDFGKNLIDLVFSTQQVIESEEHKLLSDLRASGLENPDLRETFFQKVVQSLNMDDRNYLILLAYDTYDVPYRGKDDQRIDDASDHIFRYLLCAICPVKDEKPYLTYFPNDKTFHGSGISQIVSPPEVGFLFPSFDDRAANLYHALYYTRREEHIHQELIDAIFHTDLPLSAANQRTLFQTILTDTLEQSCSYDVLQTVHEQMFIRLEEHKESKSPEPLDLSVQDISAMLRDASVPEPAVQTFESQCSTQFGPDCPLKPANLIDSKSFKIEIPQIKISVSPDSSYLVETKIINGRKYLLIPADEGIEINGVPVTFPTESEYE